MKMLKLMHAQAQGGNEGTDAAAKRVAQIMTEQAAASIAFATQRPTLHRHLRAYRQDHTVKSESDFWAGVVVRIRPLCVPPAIPLQTLSRFCLNSL